MTIHTSCLVDKIGKDKLGRAVVWRRACEHGDGDDGKASQGPDEGTAVDPGQDRVEESVDEKRYEGEADVDEELLPTFDVVALREVLCWWAVVCLMDLGLDLGMWLTYRLGVDDADNQLAGEKGVCGYQGDLR